MPFALEPEEAGTIFVIGMYKQNADSMVIVFLKGQWSLTDLKAYIMKQREFRLANLPGAQIAKVILPMQDLDSVFGTSRHFQKTCIRCTQMLPTMQQCPRCKGHYCCRECQKKDWDFHKVLCRQLQEHHGPQSRHSKFLHNKYWQQKDKYGEGFNVVSQYKFILFDKLAKRKTANYDSLIIN